MNSILNLIKFLFLFLFPRIFAQFSARRLCANGGPFLGAYCLADYNCIEAARRGQLQQQGQVCIRGLCCARTRVPKWRVNVRREDEDRDCAPWGSFSVGISCRRAQDCVRKAQQLTAAYPLLECAGGRTCCTNSQYRKPLRRGERCLNGGSARGRGCERAEDCGDGRYVPDRSNNKVEVDECVDGECCGKRMKMAMEDEEHDEEEDEDGEDEDLAEGRRCGRRGLRYREVRRCVLNPFCGDNFKCIRGHCCEVREEDGRRAEDDEDDAEGRDESEGRIRPNARLCSGTGRFRHFLGRNCVRRSDCRMPRAQVRCMRGKCCAEVKSRKRNREDEEDEWPEVRPNGRIRKRNKEEEDEWSEEKQNDGRIRRNKEDEDNWRPDERRNGRMGEEEEDGWPEVRPKGRMRKRKEDEDEFPEERWKYRRMRNKEENEDEWPEERKKNGRMRKNDDARQWNSVRNSENKRALTMIPNRAPTSDAICYDGTHAHRQCLISSQCTPSEICINQLCCPPARDAREYACGGLQGTGQCSATLFGGLCTSSSARPQHCLSPGVCCECPFGQPQPGIRHCLPNWDTCSAPYRCDPRSGFCCPRCAGGKMPFGSCHLGRCGQGFVCRPGNICCPND